MCPFHYITLFSVHQIWEDGTPDIGHKPGHEHWRERKKAFEEGISQEKFNDRMNNSDYYQLEDPSNNRSHEYEDKSEYKGE